MHPDPEINPYAPPAGAVGLPAAGVAEPIKRPAAVKCALVWALLMGVGMIVNRSIEIAHIGWKPVARELMGDPLLAADFAVRVLVFVFVFGGRRKVAYGVGVLMLAWMAWYTFRPPPDAYRPGQGTLADTAMLCVTTGLFWLLLWRFAFGKPTRRYYRLMR